MPIYTRTGDNGKTSLYTGNRVSKADPLIEALGALDELSCFIGLAVLQLKDRKTVLSLRKIQNDLYLIMAFLSGSKTDKNQFEKRVVFFEESIDSMDKKLPKLNKFIVPGKDRSSSWLHVLRSFARKAERRVVKASFADNKIIIKYLNRLSDFLFMLARSLDGNNETIFGI